MVLWPSELKLFREMRTHLGRVTPNIESTQSQHRDWVPKPPGSGGPKKGLWGPCSLNHEVCPSLDVVVGLDFAAGWSFAVGCWGFVAGLEFEVGVENAPGEAS